MRTYDETTNLLHIGVLDATLGDQIARDVPLGFLGASLASQEPAISDMAAGAARFFRCTDRMACSNPAYTYSGRDVDRLDPVSLQV